MMAQPGPTGVIAPASWWEWLYSVYPLDEFTFPCRARSATVLVAASVQNTGTIEIIDNGFVYKVASKGVRSDTGAQPGFPYRLNVGQASSDDWFGGNDSLAFSSNISGDDTLAAHPEFIFPIPREVDAGTQLTATVSNALWATSAITVDVTVYYMTVRQRLNPIVRGLDGRVQQRK